MTYPLRLLKFLRFLFPVTAFLSNSSFSFVGPWQGTTKFEKMSAAVSLKLDTPIHTFRENTDGSVEIECEAILSVNAEKLFIMSLDYDHYKGNAPFVANSFIVEEKSGAIPFELNGFESETNDSSQRLDIPEEMIIYSHMIYPHKVLGVFDTEFVSKTYLKVQPLMGILENKDFGIRWKIAEKKKNWKFDTEGPFSVIEGSWYISPIDENKSYVRYVNRLKVESVFRGTAKEILKESLGPSVRKLFLNFKDAANKMKSVPNKRWVESDFREDLDKELDR
jgi:ribosome-associated toxin RatA of RatAB toxin-antitoxin module